MRVGRMASDCRDRWRNYVSHSEDRIMGALRILHQKRKLIASNRSLEPRGRDRADEDRDGDDDCARQDGRSGRILDAGCGAYVQ